MVYSVKDIEDRIRKIEFPEGYRYECGGEEEERRESFSLMFIALIAGGLITSSFLTLLLVPVVYTLLDELGERLGLGRARVGE